MHEHAFDNDFSATPQKIEQFQRNDFVKLDGLFHPEVVRALLSRLEGKMSGAAENFKSEFSRLKYDCETGIGYL